jgi:hypothetical protein
VFSLDDAEWRQFSANFTNGGQVAALLAQAESGEAPSCWYDDLFQELCHQYTVSEAAYPAAPHLVRLAVSRDDVRKDLLVLLGACYAFSEPSKLDNLPAGISDEWRSSASRALPIIADVLKGNQSSPSDLLYLLAALAAVSGFPALARAIEAIDYEEE